VALERGRPPAKPVDARVTLTNSSGTVRAEAWAESLPLEDYQTAALYARGPYLAVRPKNAKQFVLRAAATDVRLGNRRYVRTYWTALPEWSHWVIYGLLTYLWLPALQWLSQLAWGK
jgi:hypothetical protein